MESSSGTRLGVTPPPLRPAEWPRKADYELEELGGLPYLGGRLDLSEEEWPTQPLPLELLPEVVALDIESDEAILGFANAHGVLGAWPDRFAVMKTSDFPSRRKRAIARVVKAREKYGRGQWEREFTRAFERKFGFLEKFQIPEEHRDFEFLEEFRIAAGGLASLVALARELERPRFSAARLAREWQSFSPWTPPPQRIAAHHDLLNRLNHGLQAARMTLWLLSDDAAWPMGEWVSTYELDRTKGYIVHPAPPNSLYGVCILELIEHITADRPYRICANETCGRLFSVQEGRSRYGGHRTENVKFHTPACKAAQAAREYRRRQAEKRKEKRR